jgi:phospholipid/cholesterol/gamma-HCH transport system substrate-binding protein
MNAARIARIGLSVALVTLLIGGLVIAVQFAGPINKTRITAYFDNSNGIYPGDEVRILGVRVGEIETIEPQPQRAKITFWVDAKYKVPAEAKAVVISPTVVTARFIQLTPVYTAGPAMRDDGVIPRERTAVPVEWDDLRAQLQKLNQTLQPTQPGGVSTLGAFVNTAADNLRGQGASIRDSVIKLSQTLSILGDHSGDIFGTLKNLAVLVSALHDSTDLMRQLNQNLSAVTGLLANDPNEVGMAIADLNTAVSDVRGFVAQNREPLGTTFDKLAAITQALGQSSADLKQTLHVAPTALSNFVNIYQPAGATITGALSGNNFRNPINFICGAIQAASRLGAEQSAKLCVQYLAPIVKNRQYNFLGPLGFNGAPNAIPTPLGLPFPVLPVGAQARPNEVTFSEDWMRPDYVPPAAPAPDDGGPASIPSPPLAAEAATDSTPGAPSATPTDPAAGLPGMMVPPGAGS